MNRYVYALQDGVDVFYVGKGTHADNYTNKYRRPVEHIREADLPATQQSNKRKCAKIKAILSRGDVVNVVIIKDNIDEQEAISLETELINQYGRLEDGGVLTNLITEQPMIAHERRRKPVWCFSLDGKLVNKFNSAREAAKFYNISPGGISNCCAGKYNSAAGFVWSFTDQFPGYANRQAWNKRAVDQYTIDGVKIGSFSSAVEAAAATGLDSSGINSCVIGKSFSAGGYRWARTGEHPVSYGPDTNIGGRKSKPVGQYDPQTQQLVRVFISAKEATSITGFTGISAVLSGYGKSAGGFFWKYMENGINE